MKSQITRNLPNDQFLATLNANAPTAVNPFATVADLGAGGTVTSVSVTTANGVSAVVATPTTTPALTFTLGAITPTSVNGITLSGSGSIANTGVTSLTSFTGSGTNTGDQTTSGTLNRITVTTGSTNPVIDIAATYVGQASITTLGTITTGVWNGTTIAVANGGTGLTTFGGTDRILYTTTADNIASSPDLKFNGTAFLLGSPTVTGAIIDIKHNTGFMAIRSLVGTSSQMAIYLNQTVHNALDYALTGTATNTNLNATGTVTLGINSGTRFTLTSTAYTFTPSATASGITAMFTVTSAANTNQTASVEHVGVNFNLAATIQHATGALATQRAFVITAPTYSFVGASTITNAVTFAAAGGPIAGTNATITNNHAIRIASNNVAGAGTTVNSYGLTVNAQTGATNNYIAQFLGGSVGFLTGAPNSTVHIAGSLALMYVAKTATYTASATDFTIDCTANTFTITLPTAVGIIGRIYVIKNSGAGTITLDGSGAETIDGSLTAAMIPNQSLTVQSNGANWIII